MEVVAKHDVVDEVVIKGRRHEPESEWGAAVAGALILIAAHVHYALVMLGVLR